MHCFMKVCICYFVFLESVILFLRHFLIHNCCFTFSKFINHFGLNISSTGNTMRNHTTKFTTTNHVQHHANKLYDEESTSIYSLIMTLMSIEIC